MGDLGTSAEALAAAAPGDPDPADAEGVAAGVLPHLAADALPVLISYVDAGERYRFVNGTYEEWFGRPRAEVVGRTVREVLGEAAYEKVRGHVEAALSGERLTFQGLVPYRDGGPRHIEARYEPHRGPDGRVLGYYALVTDVSARVRAEEALREAERRQAFLLALGDRLRGLADPAGVTAAAAEALGRRLGVARAGYGEIDAAGEVVSVERDWTAGAAVASLAGEARLLDGFGRAIIDELRAGRTLRVEDCLTDPRSAGDRPAAVWASIGTRALIVVPLVRDGRLTAILYLHEPASRRWTDGEAALAEDVAERTWAAVERARAEAALRDARARAEALAAERATVLGQLAEGVIVTDPAGRITFVNEAAARLHGVARLDVPPEAYSETYHLFTEDGRPHPPRELPLARAVLGGETVTDARWRIRRPDGTEVLAIGSARPLRAAPGGPAIGAVLTLRDDTAREAAERGLRESEARFRTVVEDQTEFISRFAPDPGLTITFINRAYAAQLGRPRQELVGSSLLALMDEAQRARFTAQLARLAPEAPIVSYEMDTVLPDGTPGWEHWTDRALFDAAGRLVEYQSVGRDVTAAKAAAAQRELLLAELSHRVKNTLAVVQGIASRSLTGDRPPAEARDVFARRLKALANAHSLLTASEWRGASLRTLVEGELRPYGGRAAVAGERDVALGPRAALTLSLVLHELATNAVKHGALGAPEGRVEVAWGRDGPAALRLTWRESGGPGVAAPGERRGFGRTLIERAVAHELEGEARLEFLPGGVAYELRAPMARLTAAG